MLIFEFCLLLIMIKYSISITSIKTFPTVNLTENVPIQTKVINLMENEANEYKLILLNLGGFETNLFEIDKKGNILTKNEIDREQMLGEKRCFDRLYCLIEVHILVNDGQQYWVVPIHIIDENDNKPQFKNSSIELKFILNNLNEYKIPFEGGIDFDEGINNKIFYLLDCSTNKFDKDFINKSSNKTLNCFPLFDLIIFSQSLINQNDQLGIKLNPTTTITNLLNSYELILYGFNLNKHEQKELINSMKIQIRIEKYLEKPKFLLSEYQFIIKDQNLLKKGKKIGEVSAKSNDKKEKIIYKIENDQNEIEINSITGELFILNENLNSNEINLIIEGFYLINSNLKSKIKVKILIRLLNKLNKNVLINYEFNSSLIKQINQTNQFEVEIPNCNDFLLYLLIKSFDYPFDKFDLQLLNYENIFSFSSLSNQQNQFLLQIKNNSFQLNSSFIYYLIIQIKHQLTNEFLTNLKIKFSFSSTKLCLQNSTFLLYNLNQTNLITKLKVIETNSNVFSFSTFFLSKNELILNQCRMFSEENSTLLIESEYQICSLTNQCFQISFLNNSNSKKFFILKRILNIRPIEITILSLSIVFILATITLIIIICRLRGFHLCLTMKNYLFYGKKYGLNQAQRLSSTKITQRVHSIVVRESQSPSIEHIKSLEPYIFNINQYVQQETIPSINLYPESSACSSSSSQIATPLSYISSSTIQRDQKTISNNDQENKPQISSSSSVVQETKQLLDIITSNQDFDLSQLASEV